MEKSKAILKMIDFVGADLKPTFENNTIISTALGGFISCLMIVIMVVAGGFFSQELFYRQKALVRNYSRINVDSSIDTSEFPVLFAVMSTSGVNLTNHPDIFNELNVNAYILRMDLNDKGVAVRSVLPFPVVPCSSDIIGKQAADYYKNVGFNVSLYWCMDLRLIPEEKRRVSRMEEVAGNSSINISISMCDPVKTPNCGWTMKKYGNLNFGIGFIDRFVDISDFQSPVKDRVDSFIEPISMNLETNLRISVSKNFLLSDLGYIFSDQQEETFYSFLNYDRNYASFNETTRQIFSMKFDANTKENFTERQYLKIQEFLANIGGFFKGLLFITNFINYPNSFTSLVNQIAIVERKHVQESNTKIPFTIKNRAVNSRMEADSVEEIAREVSLKVTHISFCGFLKNIFCCKFKENTKLKNTALLSLDIEEMIKQKVVLNTLVEKVQVLESAFK